MNLEQILQWLTSSDGGALIVVMWFVSWGLEELDWWQSLESKARSLIILGTAAAIALLAAALQTRPDWVAAIDPFFQPVYYVLLAWLATQTVHRVGQALKGAAVSGDVTVVEPTVTVDKVEAPAYRGGSGAG